MSRSARRWWDRWADAQGRPPGARDRAFDHDRARASDDAAELPTPVTTERVVELLTGRGFHVEADADGDVVGAWDHHRFWFLLLGPDRTVPQVRGRWHRSLPLGMRGIALQAANDWNRDHAFPKVYVRPAADELRIYAEVSADLTFGATAQQLGRLLDCGLLTGLQVFSVLDAALPQPAGEG